MTAGVRTMAWRRLGPMTVAVVACALLVLATDVFLVGAIKALVV